MKKIKPLVNIVRSLAFVILTTASIFVFTTPTFAYEEDTHFLMTYVICKSVGFTHEEALVIAAVDQGMDDSKAVNAHDNGKPQIEEEWRWHALDKDGEMHAAGIIARRDELFKEALEETDEKNRLIRLGIFFHYQQDTWAHRHHETDNHLSPDDFTTFNTPTGHGPWGSKPDRPPLDPVAALMCLEDGIVFGADFLRRGLKREPTPFLADYKKMGGTIDENWNDNRKGKFFNQLDVSTLVPNSARLYLHSLIVAQINSYTRSRDFNPFYAPRKTPDKVNFDSVRKGLQGVSDLFKSSVGTIVIPTQKQKLAQGFTEMTTPGLLNLSAFERDEKIPVVLVPGLGATDLRPGAEGIWNDGFPNDVLKGIAGDPYKLQFDSTGNPRRDTISKDMVAVKFSDVPVITDITDLSKFLQKEKDFVLDRDLFEFPYDFRYSTEYNGEKLAEFIKQIKAKTNSRQVDIIAHSMGGLIAKSYLFEQDKNATTVRKLIFVGTPHLGAPKVLTALRYGDDLGIPVIDGCKLKRAARNMPGMYNLMPGKKYFEMQGGYFSDDDDIDGNSVRGMLDYEQTIYNLKYGKATKCLLKSKVDIADYENESPLDLLNSKLIDEHIITFHDKLDNWEKPANLKVYNLVGYGLPTTFSIKESGGKLSFSSSGEGDATVPLRSAEGVPHDYIYYANLDALGCDHASMIGNKVLLEQMYRSLIGDSRPIAPNIYTSRPASF
jgi:pimeloyl-ACP methyl ester carboxylesterase